MDKNSEFYFLNGEAVSVLDINHKLFSSALYYGTGCFETMRYEEDHIRRYEDHICRLHRGLDYLQLPKNLFPEKDFLKKNISFLVNNNLKKGKAAKVRVQCSLLENNGYHLDSNVELLTQIRVNMIQNIEKPLRLMIAKTRVIPSQCRPSNLKLSNMLHYRSALREALKKDYDDAIMLSIDGYVAETSTANLFWVIGNKVFTPSIDCSILPGIMRNTIIQAIKLSKKFTLEEGIYKKESLLNADLAWISNSIIEFRPVFSINEAKLNWNEHLFEEISSTIHNFSQRSPKQ